MRTHTNWMIMKRAESQHGESDGQDFPTVRRPDKDNQIKENLKFSMVYIAFSQ